MISIRELDRFTDILEDIREIENKPEHKNHVDYVINQIYDFAGKSKIVGNVLTARAANIVMSLLLDLGDREGIKYDKSKSYAERQEQRLTQKDSITLQEVKTTISFLETGGRIRNCGKKVIAELNEIVDKFDKEQ